MVEENKQKLENPSHFIGVDPGLSGGISIWNNDRFKVFPMPTVKKTIRNKVKRDMDLPCLVDIFDNNIRVISNYTSGMEEILSRNERS